MKNEMAYGPGGDFISGRYGLKVCVSDSYSVGSSLA
jgi:hypothetical protein